MDWLGAMRSVQVILEGRSSKKRRALNVYASSYTAAIRTALSHAPPNAGKARAAPYLASYREKNQKFEYGVPLMGAGSISFLRRAGGCHAWLPTHISNQTEVLPKNALQRRGYATQNPGLMVRFPEAK